VIVNIFGIFYFGPWEILFFGLSIIAAFAVIYLITAPQDIFGAFIDEGYFGVVVVGKGKFKKIILNYEGFGLSKDWDIVSAKDNCCKYKDKSFWGMHWIWSPVERIYTHRLRWLKYDSIKKISVERTERLRQTSAMPYPFSVWVSEAEDAKRAPLNLFSVVTMKIKNPYKAIFNVTTEWIDVVTPLIQGAYVAFLKEHTFSELIKKQKALGKDLLDFMNLPNTSIYDEQKKRFLSIIEFIEEKYGVEIISLDVMDITGADKDIDAALKANALAVLKKEATITDAEAQAKKIEIIASADAKRRAAVATAFMDMLVQRTGFSIEEITTMQANEPKEFQKLFGSIIKQCNDSVAQQVSADAGSLLHILSPGGKGNNSGGVNSDLIATVAGIVKAMNMQAVSEKPQQSTQQKDTKSSSSKKKQTAVEEYEEYRRSKTKEKEL